MIEKIRLFLQMYNAKEEDHSIVWFFQNEVSIHNYDTQNINAIEPKYVGNFVIKSETKNILTLYYNADEYGVVYD